MNTITYLYFVEDDAHKLFLDALFSQLPRYFGKEELIFEKTIVHQVGQLFKKHTNSQVRATYFDVAVQVFRYKPQLDLFVVGLDLESQDETKYRNDLEELMVHKTFANFRDKSIIYISVQCIESWLYCLKYRIENSSKTKSQTFEEIDRGVAKTYIYGKSKPSSDLQKSKILEITNEMDLEYLKNQSYSFREFIDKLKHRFVN
ncbi:MAG: hypothetical protein U0V72_05600 [Cytophagales bacterium]